MEAIKIYLDNVFAAYPQTSEVKSLKRNMLVNMEEKYAMLRQGGKSEEEAAHSVISDFGNIEEITAELGLDTKDREIEETIFLSWDEAQTYIAKSSKSSILVGLGVWLIMAGVSSVMLLDNVFIMFLAIAIAVTMFIINGSRMGAYESYDKTNIRLDSDTRERIESARAKFIPRCTVMIAIGVAVIIISVGAFTVVSFPVTLFLNIVAFSVFLFILAGSRHSAFDILLGKGDYIDKKSVKKSERIVVSISAAYWPIVTAIALWQMFTGNRYFWVVWPVAGILFGAICFGVSLWYTGKR